MRQARHFMTINPHCFQAMDTVHRVTEGFVKNHLTCAPVVDQYGKLMGMISEVGLIKIFALDKMLFGNVKIFIQKLFIATFVIL